MQPVCFPSFPPSSSWTLYLYQLHLSGKVEGSGYGPQNEGAALMNAGCGWVRVQAEEMGSAVRWGLTEKKGFVPDLLTALYTFVYTPI